MYVLKSSWSYENRVSKNFVIFLNFLFTVLFGYVVFFWLVLWLGICVEVDADRITILPPPPHFFLTRILSLTQVTVISLKSAGA